MDVAEPFERVLTYLRFAAAMFVIGGVLQFFNGVLNLLFPETLTQAGVARGQARAYVATGVMVGLAIAGLALAWIRYVYRRWRSRSRNGFRHAFALAIALIVVGSAGMGAGFVDVGSWTTRDAVSAALTGISGVALLLSAATATLGILLLLDRSKPEVRAAFPPRA